jgi:hypothetical protein
MNYFLAALAVVLHTYFWGAGLSRLALPWRWRRWWWAFAPACGWALQSAVVWFAAQAGWPGTNSYGLAVQLVPLALLAVALWRDRRGWAGSRPGMLGAAVLAAAGAWLLISPMREAARGLTAVSLGSCDHADYAAGARVLAEFSKDDRQGFLDLPEVTRVGGAERFFEYWLRLNHFTPAALLAHLGSVFGYEGWQLVSVLTAMLAALNVPMVLLCARVMFGLRGPGALAVAALYAVSPLCAYGVHHGAMAQFLAMQGVMLATLAARGASWRWLPVAVIAVWLLAGSYNFILVVAFAPAGGWVLGKLLCGGNWRAAGRGLEVLAVAVFLAAAMFWGRFSGILERFQLMEKYDFGWPVPLFGPAGWLGVVRGAGLDGGSASLQAAITAIVAILLALWLWHQRRPALSALFLLLPVAAGYALLAGEAGARANASYDAYKLLMVFLPFALGGCLAWLQAVPPRRKGLAWAGRALVALLLWLNLAAQADLRAAVARAPLVVTAEIREIGKLETEPAIGALNLRVENFWARMWANVFLLRKPQYFETHSYEARLDTPLRGDWDLSDTMLRIRPAHPADMLALNPRFAATRAGSVRVRAEFGPGWHPVETDHRRARWRWSDGGGELLLRNEHGRPVPFRIEAQVRAISGRSLRLELDGRVAGSRQLSAAAVEKMLVPGVLPPGKTRLRFRSDRAPEQGGEADTRLLDVALYGFELTVLADDAEEK